MIGLKALPSSPKSFVLPRTLPLFFKRLLCAAKRTREVDNNRPTFSRCLVDDHGVCGIVNSKELSLHCLGASARIMQKELENMLNNLLFDSYPSNCAPRNEWVQSSDGMHRQSVDFFFGNANEKSTEVTNRERRWALERAVPQFTHSGSRNVLHDPKTASEWMKAQFE